MYRCVVYISHKLIYWAPCFNFLFFWRNRCCLVQDILPFRSFLYRSDNSSDIWWHDVATVSAKWLDRGINLCERSFFCNILLLYFIYRQLIDGYFPSKYFWLNMPSIRCYFCIYSCYARMYLWGHNFPKIIYRYSFHYVSWYLFTIWSNISTE